MELVAHSEYIPTTDDILHSRKMTTGIHQISFSVKIPKTMGGGNQEFRMFDVVGKSVEMMLKIGNLSHNSIGRTTRSTQQMAASFRRHTSRSFPNIMQ